MRPGAPPPFARYARIWGRSARAARRVGAALDRVASLQDDEDQDQGGEHHAAEDRWGQPGDAVVYEAPRAVEIRASDLRLGAVELAGADEVLEAVCVGFLDVEHPGRVAGDGDAFL